MAENEKGVEELENQLHQQYAENDNNRIGVFTSFIVGIIALFAAYGYVYVNTKSCKNSIFDIEVYLLMSFITMGILFFLAVLALSLGYSLRRDHLIVYNIRKKRYKAETEAETKTKMKEIFGEIYSPLGKKCCDFLPDFYNLFYWLFFSSEIFLGIITIIKVICIFIYKSSFCNCKNIICLIIFFISFIIFIFLTLKFRCCYYKKYKDAVPNAKQECKCIINLVKGKRKKDNHGKNCGKA